MENEFSRITRIPDVMTGKPTIRGMRMTVGTIVGMMSTGMSIDEILADFPFLEREDILQALAYAAFRASDSEFELRKTG